MNNDNNAVEKLQTTIDELLRLKSASNSFTKEALNKILVFCDIMIEDEASERSKEKPADIEAVCCRILRDRDLINRLVSYLTKTGPEEKYCSFTDVYANCTGTIDAICRSSGKEFDANEFIPFRKLNATADKCCLLLTLPIALAFEHDGSNGVRLIASTKNDRLELEYNFSRKAPPVADLAAECKKTDHSSGLYFTEPLLALTLTETVADLGGLISISNKTIRISVPLADKDATVNSAADSYIDNRFSLPYIMLAGIVRREI